MLLLLACAEPVPDTGEPPEPTDDSAAPEPGTTFDGTSTLLYTVDGTVVCDTTATLVGAPFDPGYTGTCDDCTWSTSITSTVTADASTADCPWFADRTFLDDGETYGLFLAAAADWDGYANVLLSGWSHREIYGGYTYDSPGPYYTLLAWDDAPYATWSLDGDSLAFDYAATGTSTVSEPAWFEVCGAVEDGAEVEVDGTSVDQDIACDGSTLDVWALDLDGSPLSLRLDTVDSDTAADLWLWLNGPDGCVELVADDELDCTYAPSRFRCPGAVIEAPEAGAWQLVVASTGEACSGERAGYRLESSVQPTLQLDDTPATTDRTFDWELSIGLTGTLGEG
jgi:hypothetical protein